MVNFTQLSSDENIHDVIKAAFDNELDVEGGWGYTIQNATIIKKQEHIKELEHTLISMRSYIEMSMTLSKDDRYGSINANEKNRENIEFEGTTFEKISYEISAMKELDYAMFINEYKEKYGQRDFDLSDHFKRRKDATLIRNLVYYFKIK